MTVHLLDASVWIAARKVNERHHIAARRLIESGGTQLAATDLTIYEVANVAVRSWGSARSARRLADLVHTVCPDRVVRIDAGTIEHAIALADEHGLSVYDASYVAVAERNEWTLVSGDHADLVDPGLAITPGEALAAD
ncbi:MAG: type II toxin-antitoxin system VapC family toxin [Conexibacter sp.]